MLHTDKRIDQYILDAAEFAQPILIHLRELVHFSCPEVKETMKWSFPHFEYRDSILCSMASFKRHCAFGFWNAAAIEDDEHILEKIGRTAMGQLGKITSLKDLPTDELLNTYILKAMILIEKGVKVNKPVTEKKTETTLIIPPDFKKSIDSIAAAKKSFYAFSHSKKKEYVDWINEAKTDSTREKRMQTALEWISEGKSRNWKYERK